MSNPRAVELYLSQDQLAALGSLAANWAFFETEMDFTITALGQLVEGDPKMQFAFDDRLKRWRKLCRAYFKDPRVLDKYIKLSNHAKVAHDTRSKFSHARALGDPKRKTNRIALEHHKHRIGSWNVQPYVLSPKRLRATANAIGRLAAHLIKVNARHLPTSPKALPCTFPAPPRGGKPQIHRGYTGSSKPKTRRQS